MREYTCEDYSEYTCEDYSIAIDIATRAHQGQFRKGAKRTPYIVHPALVALSVKTVRQMIIAMLHDVIEDCDVSFHREIIERLGEPIYDEILTCSEHINDGRPKESWRERKELYINRIIEDGCSDDVLVVILADKYRNLEDYTRLDEETLKAQNYISKNSRWFYGSVIEAVAEKLVGKGYDDLIKSTRSMFREVYGE